MIIHRSVRDLDWALIILAVILSLLGIVQIYSATLDTIWKDAWWKQVVWLIGGLIAMYVASRIDYHTLMGQVWIYYALGIVTLIATLLVGTQVFGSRRWIPLLFGFRFQVSEFVKLVIVLLVARYLSDLKGKRLEMMDVLKLGAVVGIPMLLVMKQPDLGTSLTYVPILAVGVFLGGLRWQYIVAIVVTFVILLPLGWYGLKDYQRARLVTFLDPAKDPKGAGYQVIQSKIAVGAGGIWGKGVTRGSQTQLRFLPVPHTDFIISAFAEEHGFLGIVVVLGLYFLLLMQIVQNAQTAPDRAGMFICMGIAAMLLFHLLVNAGMAAGRMPVTGIPLPFMSYGGSNVLSVFLMLGLVQNVRLRRLIS